MSIFLLKYVGHTNVHALKILLPILITEKKLLQDDDPRDADGKAKPR
jgi:hypothetical protein